MRMKVVAFGTILSKKMNTPHLNAFVQEHVFPFVQNAPSYLINPHNLSNRSLSAFNEADRLQKVFENHPAGLRGDFPLSREAGK